MTRRSPEGAFSAADLPHRPAEELRQLSRRTEPEWVAAVRSYKEQRDVLQSELDAARARTAEDERRALALRDESNVRGRTLTILRSELDHARALLAHRTADLDAVVAERDAALERVAELTALHSSEIRSAARNAASAWRAQSYVNDEQITDRLRSCLNRLVDVIRRYDEKRAENSAHR